MGRGHKRFGWKYPSASGAGNTIYNPFPGAMTTLFPLSWHQRFQWEFSLCPCQASSAWSFQQGADARLPSCPIPLASPQDGCVGQSSCLDLLQAVTIAQESCLLPQFLFGTWRNGAKTQQTEVPSIEARNRKQTVLTATREHRKSCPGLSAHRATRGVNFLPGTAGFAYDPLRVYQQSHCVRKWMIRDLQNRGLRVTALLQDTSTVGLHIPAMQLGRQLHTLTSKSTRTNQKHQRQDSNKSEITRIEQTYASLQSWSITWGQCKREDHSLLNSVSIKQKFSQHAASSAHELWCSWHSLSLLQIHVWSRICLQGFVFLP